MGENARTLLTEYASKGKRTPLEERSYHVIANRLVAMGGFECNRVKAIKVDNHYLLMRTSTVDGFYWEPFGIFDLNKPSVALNRMYNEAKRIAKERAKRDGNKIIDLTSRAEKVQGNDKFYVPNEHLERLLK